MKDAKNSKKGPTDQSTLDLVVSLATDCMHTIALQRRRLRSSELEDRIFVFREWADWQFLIVALRRMRKTAELARKASSVSTTIASALKAFDDALPGLRLMRNVGEHIDDYAIDNPKRHHKNVERGELQVGVYDDRTYQWLGVTIDSDTAYEAAFALYTVLQKAAKSGITKSPK